VHKKAHQWIFSMTCRFNNHRSSITTMWFPNCAPQTAAGHVTWQGYHGICLLWVCWCVWPEVRDTERRAARCSCRPWTRSWQFI